MLIKCTYYIEFNKKNKSIILTHLYSMLKEDKERLKDTHSYIRQLFLYSHLIANKMIVDSLRLRGY